MNNLNICDYFTSKISKSIDKAHKKGLKRINELGNIYDIQKQKSNIYGKEYYDKLVNEIIEKQNEKSIIYANEYFDKLVNEIIEKQFGDFTVEEIPDELKDEALLYRGSLIESVAEIDDVLMEKYLEGQDLTEEEIINAIAKGCIENIFFPVFCGTSYRNKCIQPLLDGIVRYLPSPLDIDPVKGINPTNEEQEVRYPKNDEPLSALVFKLASDPYIGALAFTRVYSGVLEAGSYVYNTNKRQKERVSRIVRLHSNQREDVDHIQAGDIAGIVGFKQSYTGDTICDEKHPISLEEIKFPEPVVSVLVEPQTKQDQDKLVKGLGKFQLEDPTFRYSYLRIHIFFFSFLLNQLSLNTLP